MAIDLLDRYIQLNWSDNYGLVILAYVSAFSNIMLNLPGYIQEPFKDFADLTKINFYPQSFLDLEKGNQDILTTTGYLLTIFVLDERYPLWSYEERREKF